MPSKQAKGGSLKRTKAAKNRRQQVKKGKGATDDDEAQQIRDVLESLDQRVNIASENGLFTKRQNKGTFDLLQRHMAKSDTYLKRSPPNTVSANTEVNKAYDVLNEAKEKAGLRWRLQCEYGFPYVVYLFAILAILVALVWVDTLPNSPLLKLNIVPVPKRAFMWGMIGSVLQGLYALWRQVSQRQFRRGWIIWYLALPVIGAILGALMYMAIQFGVVATTQSGIRNDTVPLLLAALAGFSWKWSVGILENVEKLFKAGTESTESTSTPQSQQ